MTIAWKHRLPVKRPDGYPPHRLSFPGQGRRGSGKERSPEKVHLKRFFPEEDPFHMDQVHDIHFRAEFLAEFPFQTFVQGFPLFDFSARELHALRMTGTGSASAEKDFPVPADDRRGDLYEILLHFTDSPLLWILDHGAILYPAGAGFSNGRASNSGGLTHSPALPAREIRFFFESALLYLPPADYITD